MMRMRWYAGMNCASMVNRVVFSLLPVSACFFFHLERQRGKTRRHGRGDETEREGGWQGASESAASAKGSWCIFGAKPAQSETPVPAAVEPRPTGRGRSGTKMRSYPLGVR